MNALVPSSESLGSPCSKTQCPLCGTASGHSALCSPVTGNARGPAPGRLLQAAREHSQLLPRTQLTPRQQGLYLSRESYRFEA